DPLLVTHIHERHSCSCVSAWLGAMHGSLLGMYVDEMWLLFNTQHIGRTGAKYGDDVAEFLSAHALLRGEKKKLEPVFIIDNLKEFEFAIPDEAERALMLMLFDGSKPYGAQDLIEFRTKDDLEREAVRRYGSWDNFKKAFCSGKVDISIRKAYSSRYS
ncbi:hypothetical protein IJT17_10680, partial [bacterium]|nr:hypothetical protein [bacterium]